jgi:hypothetical protein
MLNFLLFSNTSSPTEKIPPPTPATPAGKFFTEEELAKWVKQLEDGRYVTTGDTGRTNSSDDWMRDLYQANKLKNDAQNSYKIDRYPGPDGTGTVQKSFSPLPNFYGKLIQSAAFVGRVLEKQSAGTGMAYINAAIAALVNQIAVFNVNFAENTRWVNHIIRDGNGSFETTQWLERIRNGYDLVSSFCTTEQKNDIEAWLVDAAIFWNEDVNYDMGLIWSDRLTKTNPGAYTLTSYGVAFNLNATTVDGNGEPCRLYDGRYGCKKSAETVNNRRLDVELLSARVGCSNYAAGNEPSSVSGKTKNELLRISAATFYREFMYFGVTEDGYVWEQYRGDKDNDPQKAFHYASISLQRAGLIADSFQRTGYGNLYEYSGGKCLLKTAIKRFLLNYDTGPSGNKHTYKGVPFNGIFSGRQYFSDLYFAPLNIYWQDDEIWARIRRTLPNLPAYTAEGANVGSNNAKDGPGGAYCGLLFQCDYDEGTPKEDRVNPYILS